MRSPIPALIVLCACGAHEPGPAGPAASGTVGPARSDGVLVGVVDRAAIEADEPAWRAAREGATPSPETSRALASVPPGARVDVFLGTWCGDSRREVPRLWAALDLAGEVPFEVRVVAVDRAKDAPGDLLDGVGLEYVPTFVVTRDGVEVGRVVESAPAGIEADLLSLLRGDRTGVISGRPDL